MAARRFEDVMRGHAPQRFSAERDILHQLITMLSPSLLSAQGEAGPELQTAAYTVIMCDETSML